MSFLIYLHKEQFHAEEPQILDNHLKADTQLSFIDFIPSIVKRSSTSIISGNEIEYHPFRKMVETANKWLEDNTNYDVINCETIKILFKYNDNQNYYELRLNDISNYVFGSEKNNLLKGLRVWIKRKEINNTNQDTTNLDAGYVTDSVSSNTQESPKLQNLTTVLKRRWTQPQQQLNQKLNQTKNQNLQSQQQSQSQSNQKSNHHQTEIHSTDHSPKKSAFQQQQAFRLQQYSSQSKFFLNKLQRQQSCPQSNNFQLAHLHQQTNHHYSNQNSPVYTKQTHNQINQAQNNQLNANQSTANQIEHNLINQQKNRNIESIIIDYIDILPEYNETDNKLEKFERLDDCLLKLNELIKNRKINGQILNVETSNLEASVDWSVDSELTFTAMSSKNLNFLRCFYIKNSKFYLNEKICIFDFVPKHLSGKIGGLLKRPKFENYSLLLPKVTEFLVNNPKYKFKNAQTLDIKLKASYTNQNQTEMIDTKSMFYTEHGDYLKILRLVYSEQIEEEQRNDNQISINQELKSINQSISNLLDVTYNNEKLKIISKDKNNILIKQDSDTSGQYDSNELSKNTNVDDINLNNKESVEKIDIDNNSKNIKTDSDCDSFVTKLRKFSKEDKRQVYLTSRLFLSLKKGQTINDLKQEIQDWFKNYQLETIGKNINSADMAKPKILACETMQIFCKQEMNKNNDFAYLQKAAEETFDPNRFGSKNGYLVNVFRIYFDIGYFAWNRLGYSQKLNETQKLRRRKLNYSISVDESNLNNNSNNRLNIATTSNVQQIHKKNLNRRESVDNFYLTTSKDEFTKDTTDLKLLKLNAQTGRRRSCIENYEIKSPLKELVNKLDKQQNDKQFSINDKPQDDTIESELSFSMLANVSHSKLESSNSSLSTTNSTEETKVLNRSLNNYKDDKLTTNLKQKIKRINFKQQQSIDNVQQQENSNCLLM